MHNTPKTYLQTHFSAISTKAIELFSSIALYKEFSKGDIVIDYGKPTYKFYILEEGLVGSFVINDKGKEFIRTLYTKNNAFGALSSLIKGGSKANANYNCLTNCKVYEVDYNDFIHLKTLSPEFEIFHNKVLESIYLRSEKKIDEISLLTTKERYLNLKKDIANINEIVPQYQIAHFLNITPIQLSRIRKKILLGS